MRSQTCEYAVCLKKHGNQKYALVSDHELCLCTTHGHRSSCTTHEVPVEVDSTMSPRHLGPSQEMLKIARVESTPGSLGPSLTTSTQSPRQACPMIKVMATLLATAMHPKTRLLILFDQGPNLLRYPACASPSISLQ